MQTNLKIRRQNLAEEIKSEIAELKEEIKRDEQGALVTRHSKTSGEVDILDVLNYDYEERIRRNKSEIASLEARLSEVV